MHNRTIRVNKIHVYNITTFPRIILQDSQGHDQNALTFYLGLFYIIIMSQFKIGKTKYRISYLSFIFTILVFWSNVHNLGDDKLGNLTDGGFNWIIVCFSWYWPYFWLWVQTTILVCCDLRLFGRDNHSLEICLC